MGCWVINPPTGHIRRSHCQYPGSSKGRRIAAGPTLMEVWRLKPLGQGVICCLRTQFIQYIHQTHLPFNIFTSQVDQEGVTRISCIHISHFTPLMVCGISMPTYWCIALTFSPSYYIPLYKTGGLKVRPVNAAQYGASLLSLNCACTYWNRASTAPV